MTRYVILLACARGTLLSLTMEHGFGLNGKIMCFHLVSSTYLNNSDGTPTLCCSLIDRFLFELLHSRSAKHLFNYHQLRNRLRHLLMWHFHYHSADWRNVSCINSVYSGDELLDRLLVFYKRVTFFKADKSSNAQICHLV